MLGAAKFRHITIEKCWRLGRYTMGKDTSKILSLLTVLLLAAVIAAIVLAVLYADEKTRNKENCSGSDYIRDDGDEDVTTLKYDDVDWNDCDDIAIIGAGIAGTYAAWRLRGIGKKITVYEYSDRIGGRCYTSKFTDVPDVNLEFGAMRFIPSAHILLNRTIHDLGLRVVDFGPGFGFHEDSIIYLRGKHMRNGDIANTDVPYYLEDKHKGKTLRQIHWELFRDNTNVDPNIEGFLNDKFNLKSKDGVELWKQSRQEFYLKYLPKDTLNFIQDLGGWDSSFINSSAVINIPTSPPSPSPRPTIVKTVATGFQSIPETLMERFLNANEKHSYMRNNHLKTIRKHNGTYVLTFEPTETVEGITRPVPEGHYLSSKPRRTCASKVILAVGRVALEHLDWEGLKQPEIKHYIQHALTDVQAAKMYFAYDNPWWREPDQLPHYSLSDTPLRQTFDYDKSESTKKIVLNAAYTDLNLYVNFWRKKKDQGIRYPGNTDFNVAATTKIVRYAQKFLSQIYNVSMDDMEEPSHAAIGLLDSYPYGASWCQWKPGYKWKEVSARMIKPSVNDDVFIASNSFSPTGSQAWTDGALENMELVLKYFFPDNATK